MFVKYFKAVRSSYAGVADTQHMLFLLNTVDNILKFLLQTTRFCAAWLLLATL